MFTFLFCASTLHRSSQEVLSSAADITRRLIPALGLELVESHSEFPEINGGWFYLTPAEDSSKPLISDVVDNDLAVLLFGEVLGQNVQSPARLVSEAYLSGGAQQVQQLEGCFSAVIVDRRSQEVFLFSDLLGRRSLRYVTSEQILLVSSHDLPLVATGHCTPEFDIISVASILAFEWSLQGRSLLKSVNVCHPTEYIKWYAGHIAKIRNPSLIKNERILSEDKQGIAKHRKHMVNTMRAYAKVVLEGENEVFTDLTAGLDSRSIVALLLSVIDASRIRAKCVGGEESLDVKVARRLAKMYRIEMFSEEPLIPQPEQFLEYGNLLAFYMNGDTCSKRAIDKLPQYLGLPALYAGGGGGEIFRGYYYDENLSEPYKRVTTQEAYAKLMHKNRSRSLPWKEDSFVKGIFERLKAIVDEYANLSENGYDILDLFYLYERFRIWGALIARLPWYRNRWLPYASPHLVQMAFRMPPPIGKYCLLQKVLIRESMLKAYWVPINRWMFLPFPQFQQIAEVLNKNRLFQFINQRSFQQMGQKHKSSEQIRKEVMGGPLSSVVQELLTADDSLANEVFGRQKTEMLIKAHTSGQRNYLEPMGSLVTIECWRHQIQEAYNLAKQEH